MFPHTRRSAILALSTLILAACSPSGTAEKTAGGAPDAAASAEMVQDMILGDPNAAVTMIEYASWTCSHCAQFHIDVMPTIQANYIDTGKVRFVFREFPTPPANIAVAGFAIARCAGADKYYDVIDELFERQAGILSMARQGDQVKAALMQVAENHGISGEEAFDACLQDASVRRAIATSVGYGDAAGVTGTPTVFLNGKQLDGYEWRYLDGMVKELDAALGVSPATADPLVEQGNEGEPAPVSAVTE